MQDKRKKFYVTTPIYYVNDVPHLGHAYTTIAADVIARYKRLNGYEVSFLTGSDEHGQKVQQAAQELKVDPQVHVDRLHTRFNDLWKRLNISNTDFIRTTEERHKKIVREILQDLFNRGEIYKDSYEGWYCMPDERFWTEKDLVNGTCPECGRSVDKIQEHNYFFKMGQYGEWLAEHIRTHPTFIQPESRKNEVLGFLSKPLGDLCISRPKSRLSWGIPLPFNADYVTYVWFDALINYISALGSQDDVRNGGFWPADFHLVGKDILTTHAVYWSTMLKAMNLPLPSTIFAHGWWTVDGKKMSKSLRNVVEPNLLIDLFGVDSIRYFLLREAPFGQDADFSHKALIGRINSDLANNLGNLLNRTVSMIKRYHDGKIPDPGETTDCDSLKNEFASALPEIRKGYDELAYNKILERIWKLVDAGNKWIDVKAPWNLFKTEEGQKELAPVMYHTAESLRAVAVLIYPFMPHTSEQILIQLGVEGGPENQGIDSISNWYGLKPGTELQKGERLFPRIEEKQEQEIQQTLESASKDNAAPKTAENQDELGAPISIEDVMKLDLRVGKILEAENVKKSKKLVKLKVDIGLEIRQVVAGIATSYEPEALVGRSIILVANLKPAKLMGIESQGMVLAGSADGNIVLAGFDQELPTGARVK
ncbi:MAG: methionine--tRNA ligase [Nitrospinae bacterium CG11_big_fil_rev_8_21_14_0_20_45_15]|nr:MAG: methionine--tRNA ligase [Nitrospinae bacterium CG11_big_fil_rev_8_21_14_0_20_45_15]